MPKLKEHIKLELKVDLTSEMGRASRALGETVRKMWERRRQKGTPTQLGKKTHWSELTDSTKARILRRSRAHNARQLASGIAKDQLYGPAAVLEWGAKWDERATTNSTIGVKGETHDND